MFYFIAHGARAEATFATTSTTTEQQELSDAELAQRIHEQELELLTVSEKDRLMAESIAKACESDWQTIQAEREEPIDPSTLLEDEIIEKLAAIYIREPTAPASAAETSENQDGSIEHSIASSPDAQQFWRQCIACLVDFPYHGTARTPCGHDYCRDCIRELFQAALSDDTLFPPRCCQTAMFSLGVRLYLPQGLVEGYHEKKIEMDTVDRTYCSDPTCSAFIKSDTIKDNKAVCRKCQKETCARCKAAGHQNECPLDPSLQSILAAAAAEGWQRCRACGRMIELRTGCNHITCHCHAEFCYVCGETWKTCSCAQWDEARLEERARNVAYRGNGNGNVRAVVAQLRARHECDHGAWRHVRGSDQCEECNDVMPVFIQECRQCRLRVCRRCMNNRL